MSRFVISNEQFSNGPERRQNFIIPSVELDPARISDTVFPVMNEINRNKSFSSEEFGALVLTEKLRRAVRKHPEDEILRAALHDAGNLLLLPENERAAHRDRLLIILEASRSHNP